MRTFDAIAHHLERIASALEILADAMRRSPDDEENTAVVDDVAAIEETADVDEALTIDVPVEIDVPIPELHALALRLAQTGKSTDIARCFARVGAARVGDLDAGGRVALATCLRGAIRDLGI